MKFKLSLVFIILAILLLGFSAIFKYGCDLKPKFSKIDKFEILSVTEDTLTSNLTALIESSVMLKTKLDEFTLEVFSNSQIRIGEIYGNHTSLTYGTNIVPLTLKLSAKELVKLFEQNHKDAITFVLKGKIKAKALSLSRIIDIREELNFSKKYLINKMLPPNSLDTNLIIKEKSLSKVDLKNSKFRIKYLFNNILPFSFKIVNIKSDFYLNSEKVGSSVDFQVNEIGAYSKDNEGDIYFEASNIDLLASSFSSAVDYLISKLNGSKDGIRYKVTGIVDVEVFGQLISFPFTKEADFHLLEE